MNFDWNEIKKESDSVNTRVKFAKKNQDKYFLCLVKSTETLDPKYIIIMNLQKLNFEG